MTIKNILSRASSHPSARLHGALADRSGTATIEFAFWATLIMAGLLPCLDIAAYVMSGSSMSSALDQAAILAYNMRSSDTIDTNQMTNYVAAVAKVPGATPVTTITCNGGQQSCNVPVANRQCTCVTGLTPTYIPAASCGAICPNGATSGFYMTLQTQVTYKPIIVPDRWLAGGTLARAVTVRLQ